MQNMGDWSLGYGGGGGGWGARGPEGENWSWFILCGGLR